MTFPKLAVLVVLCLYHPSVCAAQEGAVELAKQFLPPKAGLAQFEKFDPKSGEFIERNPAVLTGHIVSEKSKDIVFAYYSKASDMPTKSLFVDLLHETKSGYVKLSEFSYYGRFLWVQDFSTIGLRLLPVGKGGRESIGIITSMGASLGAQLQVFQWDDTFGLLNTMPERLSAYDFSFFAESGRLRIVLSFEKYPGEKGARVPIAYQWEGKKFVVNER